MALLHSETVPLGFEAVSFQLPGTDGKTYALKDFLGNKKGLLVIFTCNHCPYAKAAWPLFVDLYNRFNTDLDFVAINPNDQKVYPEDSMEVMKQKMSEWHIPFPYLRDESQEIARNYKAQCTPDPYLFQRVDGVFKLFYHGRVNDNWQHPDQVKEKSLEDAMSLLINNQSAPQNQSSSMGCSIKWKQ